MAAGLAILLLSGCIGCGKRQDILAQDPVIPLEERNEKNTEEAEDAVSSLSYPENGVSDGEISADQDPAAGTGTKTSVDKPSAALDTDSAAQSGAEAIGGGTVAEVVSTQLTEKELTFFTDYFNKERANGFLSCSYDIPSRIDLTAVLKSIGFAGEKPSAKEQTEASMLFGKTEKIDVVKYSSGYLEELLHEMTGLGLSEMDSKPDCPYSSDYDAYYIKKSDIVLRETTCTAGSVDGEGIYSIFYTKAGEEGLWNVVLKKSGGEFLFHSNASLTPEN